MSKYRFEGSWIKDNKLIKPVNFNFDRIMTFENEEKVKKAGQQIGENMFLLAYRELKKNEN